MVRLPFLYPPIIISSFPRKRESTPRHCATPRRTGVLDSGLRRNDGGAAGMTVWGREWRLWLGLAADRVSPSPNPLPLGEGLRLAA